MSSDTSDGGLVVIMGDRRKSRILHYGIRSRSSSAPHRSAPALPTKSSVKCITLQPISRGLFRAYPVNADTHYM